MDKLLYYVEMKDLSNPDEWSNKIDCYGYENQILIMAMEYSKSIPTLNVEETIAFIDDVVLRLQKRDCVVINKENKCGIKRELDVTIQ